MATDIFIGRELDSAISGLYHGPASDGMAGEASRRWRDEHLALIRNLQPAQWEMARNAARSSPSEGDGRLQFTRQDVIDIRESYATGTVNIVDLAVEYGVSAATVSRVIRGETYKFVDGPTSDVDHRRRWGIEGDAYGE